MSKYIKLEDALKEFNYGTDYPVNTIIDILYDLPTIEVSDKADRPFEYFEGYEDGRKSVEVSEDCISRKMVVERLAELWETEHPEKSYDEWLEVARGWCRYFPPSVTTEQSSMVDICKVCKQYDIGYEDGRLDMLQTLSKAIDTSRQE